MQNRNTRKKLNEQAKGEEKGNVPREKERPSVDQRLLFSSCTRAAAAAGSSIRREPAIVVVHHPRSTTSIKVLLLLASIKQAARASSSQTDMASCSALITLLVLVSSVAAASAVTFTVGDSSGWTLGGVNYDNWASGKTFTDGDQLVFNFATGSHDVVEVDKSGYDGCSTSNAANTIRSGPATVNLTSGAHYYICGFTGHCTGGMKLAVNVGSGSGSGSPTPGGSPSTPAPPTPSAPTPAGTPAGASVRLTAGPALAVAAAVLVKFALF